MSLNEKLIINAALTGMVPTQKDNPHVPITPEEIAADARRCTDAGASILHLHARDSSGQPTYRKEIYREILERVRALCPEAILCVSTSGRTFRTFEQRAEVLDLGLPAHSACRPEMASLTLGSMNFARQESVNSPDTIRALAMCMREHAITPELEIFEIGMAEYAHHLIREGLLRPPYYANILLGSRGTLGPSPLNLSVAVRALPAGTTWAAAGIGRSQFEVNALAITMGGHVRTGLEDNLWLDRERRIPATNPGLIDRLTTIARAVGREIATPREARAMIGLPQPDPALQTRQPA